MLEKIIVNISHSQFCNNLLYSEPKGRFPHSQVQHVRPDFQGPRSTICLGLYAGRSAISPERGAARHYTQPESQDCHCSCSFEPRLEQDSIHIISELADHNFIKPKHTRCMISINTSRRRRGWFFVLIRVRKARSMSSESLVARRCARPYLGSSLDFHPRSAVARSKAMLAKT